MIAIPTAMPAYTLATSLIAAVLIFALGDARRTARTVVNLLAAVIKLGCVLLMLYAVWRGQHFEVSLPVGAGLELLLIADRLSLLFITLSAVLWLLTTVYAVGYLEDSPQRARFFGFFSLCVAATMGIASAGNLFTFFIFYEALTLATYPLVAHRGTVDALRGARVYLAYTLTGGVLLLAGIIWLEALGVRTDFGPGGQVDALVGEQAAGLRLAFWLLVAGIGVKAAIVPLHGWLPIAMVAPAPVSALLHAVAVVKAGAFGIVRVVLDIFGSENAALLGLLLPLAVIASITIVYGSVRALMQTDIKKRLAYSTVSQVSYIVLGVSLGGPVAAVGGLVHLVHQGLMKITLFFCAGNWAETLNVKRVDELNGIGRRMPLTTAAFTVAALGMIGVPPIAGFISKWYLGLGAVQAGQGWAVGVLVASTLLNAAYFLPVIVRAWFAEPPAVWAERIEGLRAETLLTLLVPTLLVAAMAVGTGLFAALAASPLSWAEFIVREEYLP